MNLFIVIGFFVVAIGLVILLIDWVAWYVGIMLITVGLAKLIFYGWASKKIFT